MWVVEPYKGYASIYDMIQVRLTSCCVWRQMKHVAVLCGEVMIVLSLVALLYFPLIE